MADITYRHSTKADMREIVDVFNLSRRELPMHQDILLKEIEDSLFKDNHFSMEDSCWLALIDDLVVGYGFVFAEESRIKAGKSDADVTIEVLPEHRDKGVQQGLMNLALGFLGSMKMRKAKHLCANTSGWKHDLSLEFGFEDNHHQYTMIWRDGEDPSVHPTPDGIHLEHRMFKEASDEDIVEFTEVNNEFYSERLDFAPEMADSWIMYRDELKENVERITFARDGLSTIGACSCEEWTELNRKKDVKAGYISTLGVVKPYRKKGIGRAILSDAMTWLCERGMDTVYLRIDTGNPNALRLYTSSGFEIHKESVVYSLTLE
jgi:ribosomal protein S18 acetylase RimI-like enzyme